MCVLIVHLTASGACFGGGLIVNCRLLCLSTPLVCGWLFTLVVILCCVGWFWVLVMGVMMLFILFSGAVGW